MLKKNILIVSRSFYPMDSPRFFRTMELVEESDCQGKIPDILELEFETERFFKKFTSEILLQLFNVFGFKLE